MRKALSPDCLYCSDIDDNAEHTFFNCDRWATRRASLVADIRMIAPDNIVGAMLRREDVWDITQRQREKKGDLECL